MSYKDAIEKSKEISRKVFKGCESLMKKKWDIISFKEGDPIADGFFGWDYTAWLKNNTAKSIAWRGQQLFIYPTMTIRAFEPGDSRRRTELITRSNEVADGVLKLDWVIQGYDNEKGTYIYLIEDAKAYYTFIRDAILNDRWKNGTKNGENDIIEFRKFRYGEYRGIYDMLLYRNPEENSFFILRIEDLKENQINIKEIIEIKEIIKLEF